MYSTAHKSILILGGTGTIGQLVIKEALKAGYKVRSLTRSLSKAIKFSAGSVEWLEGNSEDAKTLKKAAEGQSIIISTVGPPATGTTTLYSKTTNALLEAMRATGVKRLVVVSACLDLSLYLKSQRAFLEQSAIIDDMKKMEDILEKEGKDVEWTVTEPFFFEYKPYKGKYRVAERQTEPPIQPFTNTGDLAYFLFTEAVAKEWVHKRVLIGNKS